MAWRRPASAADRASPSWWRLSPISTEPLPVTPATERATVLACRDLVKRFDQKVAIDGVSFDVGEGEIVGLLGPNGAGKTTLIRMIIDIFPPDEGSVSFLGRRLSDRIPADMAADAQRDHPTSTMRDLLGYLPEERGLYRRGRLAEVLAYLGQLRGLSAAVARQRVAEGLNALGFSAYADKKVIDLSKGMTQRVQFLAAEMHRPRLMILDEPFSGLDPIGVQWAMEQIERFRAQGATILLSAHQMAMVERLCDRVVMIDQGRRVLYGTLDEVRGQHARRTVDVTADCALDALPAFHGLPLRNLGDHRWEIGLPDGLSVAELLTRLVAQRVPLTRFEVAQPSLEQIFLDVVGRQTQAPDASPTENG